MAENFIINVVKSNKAMRNNKDRAGPSVFRFEAQLVRHPKRADQGGWGLVNVPKSIGKQLRGMTTIEGTINGHPFRAALEPNSSGSHSLRVNQAMRRGASADPGDKVQFAILGPEPEPKLPADLRVALSTAREAKTLWGDLTRLGRLDWMRWINSAKTPETRARRVRRTVEQLSSGKRRPCCVNFYEFMLHRVGEQ
ncbi:MAG: DUF1905 domain-containing protein [Candidatus Eremiobacteraeota bacterium]|nr:DUF1905 domain-containing protein [Candidatus Eremiobacteraeota bacterium]